MDEISVTACEVEAGEGKVTLSNGNTASANAWGQMLDALQLIKLEYEMKRDRSVKYGIVCDAIEAGTGTGN